MIYTLAFALTGAGLICLAGALALFGWQQSHARYCALATGLHGAWALTIVMPGTPLLASGLLQTAHFLAWPLFFTALSNGNSRPSRLSALAAIVLLCAQAAVLLTPTLAPADRAHATLLIDLTAIVLAFTATVGVFQAAGESARWSLKFLCLPLAAIFAYDLILYTQTLASSLPGPGYFLVRAGLNALAVPLIAIGVMRAGLWRERLEVSRQATLYSLTFIGIGVYLMLVAGAAVLLDRLSTIPTGPLQLALVFGAILVLAFVLASGRARAQIKLFLGRHVYAQRYDYAHEWRRFMQTLAAGKEESPLENRIIRACADLLEVPGGALWLFEGERPSLHATWNFRRPPSSAAYLSPGMFFNDRGEVTCLYGGRLARTPLAETPQAWLVAPLPHGNDVIGFLILSPPRAPHAVDSQDEALLLLVARQCASYLAESRLAQTLEEARQFERFNRQYAFVAHDIKNIISQLSVMLRNFDKHADNPEFQRDIHDTIRNTVDRLQTTMSKVRNLDQGDNRASGERADDPRAPLLDVVDREISARAGEAPSAIQVDADERAKTAHVRAPAERLGAIFGHLLSNARDAGGEAGQVAVSMRVNGRFATLDVIDDGPGMSADFIRNDLFRPFRTTKAGGFGVGAYQCREFARENGGDLEVISSPGSGTTMRLRLPLATPAASSDHAAASAVETESITDRAQ